jgi:hypothetical protein
MAWRVLDAQGREVSPAAHQPDAQPADHWNRMDPTRENGIGGWGFEAGLHKTNRSGLLDLRTRAWKLLPGRYSLACTFTIKDGKLPEGAWVGELEVPPVSFEVFPSRSFEEVKTEVERIRKSHPKGGEALWRALAELAVPGTSLAQLEVVLPPVGTPLKERNAMAISGAAGTLYYLVDRNFGVRTSIAERDDLAIRTESGIRPDMVLVERATVVRVRGEPAQRAALLRKHIAGFRMYVQLGGPKDLKFPSFTFRVDGLEDGAAPPISISRSEVAAIVEHLATDGFFEAAQDVGIGGFGGWEPYPTGPCCILYVQAGDVWNHYSFTENLGWNAKMVQRLEGLRKVLDGDAAKAMDGVLKALEPLKRKWEGRQVP